MRPAAKAVAATVWAKNQQPSISQQAENKKYRNNCTASEKTQYKKNNNHFCFNSSLIWKVRPEVASGQSKETALVIFLAFLAKVANLCYMKLTAFKKYWSDTVATFISGTQETFIEIKRQK